MTASPEVMSLTPATPALARHWKHIVSHRTSGSRSQTQFRVTLLLTGAACLIAPALVVPPFRPALAQQPQQQPTFKVSVNVVDVDVTVNDAQGNFVPGLTPTTSRSSRTANRRRFNLLVHRAAGRAPGRVSLRRAARRSRCPLESRRRVGPRVHLVLDDLNVAPLRTGIVRRHARDFIERHFGPNDLAAVVVTSGRKDAAQEFTNDPALLLRAVDSFVGQRLQSAEMQRIDDYYQSLALSGLDTRENRAAHRQAVVPNLLTRMQSFDPSNLERGQRAVGVLNTVRSLTEYLESVRGRRKALLWFSEGIDYPMAEISARRAETKSPSPRETPSPPRRGPTSTSSRSIRAG